MKSLVTRLLRWTMGRKTNTKVSAKAEIVPVEWPPEAERLVDTTMQVSVAG